MGQKVSFYADEHGASAVVHGLRQRGVDVLTVTDARLLSATDEGHQRRGRGPKAACYSRRTPTSCGCMRRVRLTLESSTRPKGPRSATSSAG